MLSIGNITQEYYVLNLEENDFSLGAASSSVLYCFYPVGKDS